MESKIKIIVAERVMEILTQRLTRELAQALPLIEQLETNFATCYHVEATGDPDDDDAPDAPMYITLAYHITNSPEQSDQANAAMANALRQIAGGLPDSVKGHPVFKFRDTPNN